MQRIAQMSLICFLLVLAATAWAGGREPSRLFGRTVRRLLRASHVSQVANLAMGGRARHRGRCYARHRRHCEKWQNMRRFLRPLLERLKKVDGRAPVSIMTCRVDPTEPHLQTWLQEGVSLETHTADHPCPCLQGGRFEQAKSTFDACVDQLSAVPGSPPRRVSLSLL